MGPCLFCYDFSKQQRHAVFWVLFIGSFGFGKVWSWVMEGTGFWFPSSCLHHRFPGFAHLVWINFLVESPVEVSACRFGCMVSLDPFKKDSKLQWETRKVSSFCWFFVRLSFYVCSYSLKMGTSNNTSYSDFRQQKTCDDLMSFHVIFPQMNISLAMFSVGAWNGQVNGHQAPKKWVTNPGHPPIASQVPIQLWWWRSGLWGISPTRLVGKLGWGRCDLFW